MDIENILRTLRESGHSKVESIKILADNQGIPLDKAKKLVHKSKTWSDVHNRDAEFHETLRKSLKDTK